MRSILLAATAAALLSACAGAPVITGTANANGTATITSVGNLTLPVPVVVLTPAEVCQDLQTGLAFADLVVLDPVSAAKLATAQTLINGVCKAGSTVTTVNLAQLQTDAVPVLQSLIASAPNLSPEQKAQYGGALVAGSQLITTVVQQAQAAQPAVPAVVPASTGVVIPAVKP